MARAALKVMSLILLCWMLVVWQQRLNPLASILLKSVAMQHMMAERHSGKMTSDIETSMKQKCAIESLYVKDMDVSTVR